MEILLLSDMRFKFSSILNFITKTVTKLYVFNPYVYDQVLVYLLKFYILTYLDIRVSNMRIRFKNAIVSEVFIKINDLYS